MFLCIFSYFILKLLLNSMWSILSCKLDRYVFPLIQMEKEDYVIICHRKQKSNIKDITCKEQRSLVKEAKHKIQS